MVITVVYRTITSLYVCYIIYIIRLLISKYKDSISHTNNSMTSAYNNLICVVARLLITKNRDSIAMLITVGYQLITSLYVCYTKEIRFPVSVE